MRMIRFALLVLALCLALPAVAQEEDEGFLTRKIQELFSTSGRAVDIVGFEGALSAAASFERMTIADAQGVWLTLEDVVLDWNRAALLRGRLEVTELSAARIDISRAPVPAEAALPDPQAKPFTLPQLPELPVSIDIAALNVARLTLGAALLGEAVEARMTARAALSDAGLDMAFTATRTDDKRGDFDVTGTLSRDTNLLDLALALSEQEGGIVATALDIPDTPAVDLSVQATGPLEDVVTQLRLETGGQERLAGEIKVITSGDADYPDRRIVADIGGDLTAIILPQYRDFFGPQVSLTADATLVAGGAVRVETFDVQAAAVDLTGRVTLSESRWPSFIDIEGRVARADGAPVLLPGGGARTTVGSIVLDIDFDAARNDGYGAVFDISDLKTEAGAVAQTRLRSTGSLTGARGVLDTLRGTVEFAATGIDLVDAALSEAVGPQISGTTEITHAAGGPLRLSNLDLRGGDYGLQGDMGFSGPGTGLKTMLDAVLSATDLSRFSALAGRELDGASMLSLSGVVTPLSGAFDLQAKGAADSIKTGIAQVDALLEGRTDLSLRMIRDESGTFLRGLDLRNDALRATGDAALGAGAGQAEFDILLRDIATVLPQYSGPVTLSGSARESAAGWQVDVNGDGPYGAALRLGGLATGPDAALEFSASVPRVADFAVGIDGPLQADGTLRQTPQGWLLQTDASGPYGAAARLNGLVTPRVDLGFDVSVPQVAAIAPQVRGALAATGRLRQTETGFAIQTDATGPYNARVSVNGALTPALDVAFDLSLPDVSPLASGASGPLSAKGNLSQTAAGLVVRTNATGPYSTRASVAGLVTGPNAQVDFTLAMPDLAAVVPNLSGPLNATGSAAMTPQGWQLNTDARGPAGTQAQISGLVGNDGLLNMRIVGNAPLGLAGPFIAPRSLQGQARFDLVLNGSAALASLSGTVQTSNATLSAPNLRAGLEGINANITLANSRAVLDVSASASGGGRLGIAGSVGLGGALPADIAVTLDGIAVIDPRLYRTSISGGLTVSGPLAGGAQIGGTLTIGETIVTVPSTGLTSIGDIPPITHLGATNPNLETRRKAGLLEEGAAADPTAGSGGGAVFDLNITVNAPGRIFVRGRGLDAELGGRLLLTGNTGNIISAGRFELARGRLDILGKRFDLAEGSAEFQGDFIPYIRFVSNTSTQNGTASVIVEGPANAPEVTFESNPAGPQDEVLAQLLFGRNLSEISAFQALQLANAVATLAGRGGNGVVGNLRDKFGLDDLDVTTTDSGETALRVGKYLTDNVYTDVTAASDGTGEVSLNIDITPNLVGKATLGSDGNSSVGIFFEKDY
jgi:translocation and assembly module TamB